MARPPRFDFLISNPGHHLAMTLPVMARLREAGGACRVLSLCELRGFETPEAAIAEHAACLRLVPWNLRRSPASGAGAGPPGGARRWARALAWAALPGPRLRAALRRRPDVAIVPNDSAFPYDRIVRLLRRRGIPFLLIQEGIRFPLPGGGAAAVYGAGGAAAIAAWGEASAEYFRGQGVPAARVHPVGNPRFDGLARQRPAAPAARTLALLTNPIDDLGFCSASGKHELVSRFLGGIEPLFDDPGFRLVLRPHPREDPELYRRLLRGLPAERARVLTEPSLDELLAGAGAVVVLASTVGLEALLRGLPLGVLELPGHGFQYDYVQSGAAAGLSWSEPMAPQVAALFDPSPSRTMQSRTYLRNQLDARGGADRRVAALARSLIGS